MIEHLSAADWNTLQKRNPKRRRNQKPEAKVLKSCLQWLIVHHISCWRSNTGAYSVKDDLGNERYIAYGAVGSPDICGIMPATSKHPGVYLGVETKAAGKKLKPEQQTWKEMVERNQGIYIVAYSTDDLEAKLKPLL